MILCNPRILLTTVFCIEWEENFKILSSRSVIMSLAQEHTMLSFVKAFLLWNLAQAREQILLKRPYLQAQEVTSLNLLMSKRQLPNLASVHQLVPAETWNWRFLALVTMHLRPTLEMIVLLTPWVPSKHTLQRGKNKLTSLVLATIHQTKQLTQSRTRSPLSR